MEKVHYIENIDQARALLKPLRLEIMRQLVRPRTCNDLAETFGASAQKVYYHVKLLERAGLVEKIAERKVRGLRQGIYQAKASSYWLAPQLAGGMQRPMDQVSLSYLLSLAEQIHFEVAQLSGIREETPTVSINAQIELAGPADRADFLAELKEALGRLAEKYGARARTGRQAEVYRLMAASYPVRGALEEA